jgi:5-methylthioadenosine/S-adenosylhomocysteine deaminase
MSLGGYFGRYLGNVGPAFGAEQLHVSTLLGAVEALEAGVTTLFDWCNATNSPTHADAAVEALEASGIRAVFGHGNPSDEADVRRIRDRLGDTGLVTMGLALIGPEFGPVEAATREIELARELDVIASMHVGCGTSGPRAAAVSELAAGGLLGPDLNFVHCNTISDAEVAWIVDTGSTVSITPLVECLMGHGTPALARFLRAGGAPSVGVDVVVASASDLFGQRRAGLSVARMVANQQLLDSGEDPKSVWPPARDLLRAATLSGAQAAGLADRVGSLTVGKQADIAILRPRRCRVTQNSWWARLSPPAARLMWTRCWSAGASSSATGGCWITIWEGCAPGPQHRSQSITGRVAVS